MPRKLKTELRATGAYARRGLTLRIDRGTHHATNDFINRLKFCAIVPSFAFIAELRTNGIAEHVNRTLKEQAIHGRWSCPC